MMTCPTRIRAALAGCIALGGVAMSAFVLASYDTGPGQVQDAQRLAEKNGRNPLVWNDVAFWLLQKSKRAVYSDPVVRHGFSRGLEPVLYVQKILERFEHYRQFVPAAASPAA